MYGQTCILTGPSDVDLVVSQSNYNDGANTNAGRVLSWKWNGTNQYVVLPTLVGGAGSRKMGRALDATYNSNKSALVIAAGHMDYSSNKGVVSVKWLDSDATWTSVGSDVYSRNPWDRLGGTVRLSNEGVSLVASSKSESGDAVSTGHVNVYRILSGTWMVVGFVVGKALADRLGFALAASDNRVASVEDAAYVVSRRIAPIANKSF